MKKSLFFIFYVCFCLWSCCGLDFFEGEDGFIYLKGKSFENSLDGSSSKDERGLLADFDINGILDSHFLIDENEKFSEEINKAAAKYSVEPFLIKAFIKVESDFNERALSSKGAIGLMQLMPDKAPDRKINLLYKAGINIDIGVKYISYLQKRFEGNAILAIAAYNAGPTIVGKLGKIPAFRETRKFVDKILWFYNYYKNMSQEYRNVKDIMTCAYNEYLKENYQKAISLLEKAAELMPDNGYIHFNIGLAYSKIRIDHLGVEHFKKAISCNPYIKEAYYNLGILYAANQNRIAAAEYFNRYYEIAEVNNKDQAMKPYDREVNYP